MQTLTQHARTLIALIGFASAVLLPPYVPLACIFLLALRFRAIEALFIGLFLDLLWLPQLSFHTLPLATCFAIAVLWIFEPLRTRLLS